MLVENWMYKWLDVEKAPFVYSNVGPGLPLYKWAGFEDVRSIDNKVKYLLKAGLGGATLFTISYDDKHGHCYRGRFPLLKVINFYLNRKVNIAYPKMGKIFQNTEAALISDDDNKVSVDVFFEKFDLITNSSNLKVDFAILFCYLTNN